MFGFIKKYKKISIILGSLVGLAIIGLALTLMLGGNKKLSFTDDMVKECVVNESCNISNYVNNPQGKTLKLMATYKDEFGLEMECMVAGLAFKPTEITEVNLKVEAEDGEAITATVQVVEAAPSLVTTNEATYFLDQTIQLSELKKHVVYTSHSEPEFEVLSMECGTEKEDLKGKKEYTFKEVGAYTFAFNLSNPTGSVEGYINVKVTPELTENELYDMTNNSYVNAGSQATLSLNREEHAKNSDWSWAVKANPAGVWQEEGGSYYIQTIMIDFGMEIDASKLYFTMDLLANENTAGICIHYTNGAGQVASGPMGFQDVLGEWTTVSSKGLVSEGIYSGVYILVLHKMEGEYDASNVVALIDNFYLHEWDPNAPIIVGGTEDYAIKDGVIAWNSTLKDNGVSGNYVQFNKQYKNETLTFTMPIEDAKNPGLALGARMDGAKVNYAACQGLLIKFYDEFFEVYAPGYGQWVGAYNVVFKSGERYTFSYSVESASGKDMLYLKIQEAATGTIIVDYELELPKNVVASSGYLVIWSTSQKMAIEYKEPAVVTRKSNVNVTVDKNGNAGIASLSSASPGNLAKAAYLAMKGDYTNETFAFSTKIQDATSPNLVIGARMEGVSTSPSAYKGLSIRLYDKFLEVYGPDYGTIIGAAELSLKSGETYDFAIDVATKDGVSKLTFVVKQGNTVILNYKLENIKAKLPTSGNFMVWTLNEATDVTYSMPGYVEKVENTNVIVEKTGKAGTAKLKTVMPNDLTSPSYLAMKGNYTNETFAFSTKIQNATSPNLIIGARMEEVSTSPSAYKGLSIRLYDKFIEVYGPDYGTIIGAAELSLKSGETYDFAIDVATKENVSKLTFVVKQGNTVILNYILNDIKAKLPASGNFMVWTLNEATEIAYSMPSYVEKVENTNIIVEKTGQAGTAELKTVMPNNLTAASYLAMKGDYTNETFTFTTKIEAAAGPTIPQLMLGARMTGIGGDPFTYEGIMISVYEGFIEVYAPQYGAWIDATSLNLTAGETYTFSIQVNTESGVNTLYFVVKQGDTQILNYQLPNISTSIPTTGNFIVWNLNPTRNISYEMPKYVEQEEQPVNQNAIVESTGTAGTAALKTVTPNDASVSSYLAMKGTYTNEVFEFTTKIADVANPNLLIGAHMAGVDAYAATHRGFTMRIYEGFFEAFGTTYLDYAAYKADTLALSADVEYTFRIQVIDKKTVHLTITSSAGTVYDKDIVFDTEVLPESGNFMVWNLDAERTVSYKMPESQAVAPTENQNVVVEANGAAGTAVLKTVTPNNPGVSSYLAMKGAYTNEIFEFTTTIADAANPNLLIGAHMAGVDSYAGTHNGFTLRFYEGFFEAFGVAYLDYTSYKADIIALSANVEYTFRIQVVDKKTVHLTVTSNAGIVYDKDIVFDTEVTPANGNFMVWNMDAERSVTYKMPESVQQPPQENQNAVVETNGTAGTVTLKTITPNDVTLGSYLAVKGNYTDEVFEFTTKIADATKPNLLIGAHMAGVASYAGAQNGFVLQFHNGFFEAFSTAYLDYTSYKADTLALSANVEYTFGIQVVDKKTVHLTVTSSAGTVYDKDIVFDTEVIPANGNFMVWNMDAERIVTYKMPKSNVVSGNALTATEASGNILLTAPAGTGSVENLSYIVSASEYSDKTFEVTMNVAQGEDPYFIMGARVKGCQYYPSIWGVNTSGGQGGVLVEIHNNFYTIHAPGFLQKLSEKNYTGGIVLEGQYTFGVKVTTVSGTSQILFTVKQGDTLVHSETIDTDVAIPATGNFVTWVQKEQAFKYKISE